MKNGIVVGGLLMVLASAGGLARGQSGPLEIRVEVKTDNEHKYKSHKLSQTRYTRQLEVIVRNLVAELYEPKDMRPQYEKAIGDAANSVSRWEAAERKLSKGRRKK